MRISLFARFRLALLLLCLALPDLGVGLLAQEEGEDPDESVRRGRDLSDPLFRYSQRRRELEAKGMISYFYSYLGHNRGPVLAQYLNKWKTEKGEIWHSEPLHLLVITDTPENIELLKTVLKIIDRPDPQVMIECRVVEVTYDTVFELGGELSWNGTYEVVDTNENLLGTLGGSSSVFNPDSFLEAVAGNQTFQGASSASRLVVDAGSVTGTLDYTLRTLEQRGQAEILSAPRIMVVNGKKATIHTGEKVPVQTVQIKNGVQTITTQFQDVGVILAVSPHIMGDKAVELQVSSQVSAVTDFTDPGVGGISNPVISIREVDTTVYVRDGETLIIGGLLESQSVISEKGVPYLMDIPLLGYLFKSYKKTTKKTELIFFLTPHLRLTPQLTLPPRERER